MGGTVCGTHGGRAPQVKKAARARLAELVSPSINKLATVLKQPITSKYVPVQTQVAVARDVLDRNGYKAKDELVLTQQFDASRFNEMSDEEVRTLLTLLRKASVATEVAGAED